MWEGLSGGGMKKCRTCEHCKLIRDICYEGQRLITPGGSVRVLVECSIHHCLIESDYENYKPNLCPLSNEVKK